MTAPQPTTVRRVRADEWERVRDLRLEALRDPAAPIAFLDTSAHAAVQPASFWIGRTTAAATERTVAQFVAERGGEWVGSVTVIVRPAGAPDHLGRPVEARRADAVGVYVRPDSRGDGTIDRLFAAVLEWARGAHVPTLSLDVHVDNLRAQGAYRRVGFRSTGEVSAGPIGDELRMARAVS
ncbi:acetyltransferase [Microbacterium mangrovi]|uniref:Acetyltransferase n=1 Tax=Microbacterium mangrovi TaxID=1348253 RepID=A0A0B2AA11_9MICO|nr:GNAT family N-acetyltransferase [Microbacterium mangrovi]KHK98397.1 acetyltransferase [Microbacterium mangrovi]